MNIALEILLCILAADFLTGLVHWWEDTYGLPTWPVIGKLVIEPNIEHHRNPGVMASMWNFGERNLQSLLLAVAGLGIASLLDLLSWQFALVAILAGFGNEVHSWNHGGPVGGRLFRGCVRLIQDMAIVQTPQHHAKHHRPPFNRRFCTLTNLVNPILDRILFWRWIETVLALVGICPNRMTQARGGL